MTGKNGSALIEIFYSREDSYSMPLNTRQVPWKDQDKQQDTALLLISFGIVQTAKPTSSSPYICFIYYVNLWLKGAHRGYVTVKL